MKLILSLFSVFIITLNGSAQSKKFATAAGYNDFIVAEQMKIANAIKAFNDIAGTSKDTVEIHVARKAIVRQADSSVKQLKLLVSFNGDTALKNNAMRLFSFYSKIAANEYKQLVRIAFNTKKTNDEINKEVEAIVKSITDNERLYDIDFNEAQKGFAAKNHIDLKANEFKIN